MRLRSEVEIMTMIRQRTPCQAFNAGSTKIASFGDFVARDGVHDGRTQQITYQIFKDITKNMSHSPINPSFPHLLHGGDYNPEQWIDYPGIWEQDQRLMTLASINITSVGIFSWASLEPEINLALLTS